MLMELLKICQTPVANAVNRMLDHIHKMDDRMDTMCTQLQHLGSDFDFEPLPGLKDVELDECASVKKD